MTIVGRLAADPDLRFTPNGVAVCSVRVVTNARKYNKNTNTWEDEPPCWFSGSVWRQAGENVQKTLKKGDAVIVVGTYKQRPWESKEGQKNVANELDITAIGPDLSWATAEITKNERSGGGSTYGGQSSSRPSTPAAPAGDADPFGMPAGGSDEPPF